MTTGFLVMLMMLLTDGKNTRCSKSTDITVAKFSRTSISCPQLMSNSSDHYYELQFNKQTITKINLSQKQKSSAGLFSGQFEVTVGDSGTYICKKVAYYPPPDSHQCHATEVTVGESLQTTVATIPAANQSCPNRTSLLLPEEMMWAGSGILLVYSLSVTCFTIAIWRKLKKYEEDTKVYVNTKPG